MDENTNNAILTLIDSLSEATDKIVSLSIENVSADILLDIIFESLVLGYDNELRVRDDALIISFLKSEYSGLYEAKKKELIAANKKEAE